MSEFLSSFAGLDIDESSASNPLNKTPIVSNYSPKIESSCWFLDPKLCANPVDDAFDLAKMRATYYLHVKKDYAAAKTQFLNAKSMLNGKTAFELELLDSVVRCCLLLKEYEEANKCLSEMLLMCVNADQQFNVWMLAVHYADTTQHYQTGVLFSALLLLSGEESSAQLWTQLAHLITNNNDNCCDQCKRTVQIGCLLQAAHHTQTVIDSIIQGRVDDFAGLDRLKARCSRIHHELGSLDQYCVSEINGRLKRRHGLLDSRQSQSDLEQFTYRSDWKPLSATGQIMFLPKHLWRENALKLMHSEFDGLRIQTEKEEKKGLCCAERMIETDFLDD